MHTFAARDGGLLLHSDEGETDIESDCPDLDDYDSDDNEEGHLAEYSSGCSTSSDEGEENIITKTNLLSEDFEQSTRQWNIRVGGHVVRPSSNSGATSANFCQTYICGPCARYVPMSYEH